MRRAILLSLLFAVFAVGCRPGQEQVQFPRRSKMYRTLASLSPGTTEVAASLAVGIKMVGRTAACDFPPYVITGPNAAPIVAQVKPDYEKLKAGNPGLVVYDATLYNEQDVAQIKSLGIDVFEFKASSLDAYQKEIERFGAMAGTEMEASNYIDRIVQERKIATSQVPKPAPRIALILAGKGGEHYIAGTKGFHADVLRAAGGEAVGPEQDRYVPIDAESLIKLDPDMIITAGSPNSLVADPRLKSMGAIAKLKVRGIDEDLATRMGYRVDIEINRMHRAIMMMAEGE